MILANQYFADVPNLTLSGERSGNVAYFKVSGVARYSVIRVIGDMVLTVVHGGKRYILSGVLPMNTVPYQGQTLNEDAHFEVWLLEPSSKTPEVRLILSPFSLVSCCKKTGLPLIDIADHRESTCAPNGFCTEWCAGDEPTVPIEVDSIVYDGDNPGEPPVMTGSCDGTAYVHYSTYVWGFLPDTNPNTELTQAEMSCHKSLLDQEIENFWPGAPRISAYKWVYVAATENKLMATEKIQNEDCDFHSGLHDVSSSFGGYTTVAVMICL